MRPPFQQVIDEHAGAVFRFLVALCGRADAEDCFQETILAALRAYPRLRHTDNLRGWLLAIAHRKSLDTARRRGRAPVPVAEVPEGPVHSADGHREIWTLVARLPDKQRAAVYLRYAGGFPYREVARVIDCSEEAARRNAHEGIKKLRQEWRR